LSPVAKSKLRSKLFLAGGALLVVPFLLLCAEGATRLFAPRLDPLAVFVTSPQLRTDTQGETTQGIFEFDPLLTWRLRASLRDVWWDFTPVKTNTAGLRMDREIGPKKGIRVVCLGDSVTFGYRVPLAEERGNPAAFDASEKAYPALLEELLKARFPGKDIEVLPLACPGYTSSQGFAWLRRDLDALQPDLVTACFGWNDARAAGLPDRLTFPQSTAQVTARRIMARSQLLLHLAKSAQSGRARELMPDSDEPRSSVQEYVENFRQMRSAAQDRHAWFGIILPVYRDPNTAGDYPEGKGQAGDPAEAERIKDYRDQLRSAAKQHEIPHLLVPELTEAGWPKNAELFGERIHPNAAGHRLLAERLAEFLVPELTLRVR
jgi:lysophospholipase L1-like esterase